MNPIHKALLGSMIVSLTGLVGACNSTSSPAAPSALAAEPAAQLAASGSSGGGGNSGGGNSGSGKSGGGGSNAIRVRCEVRSTKSARSKISIDGNNLAPGAYRARAASGANATTSAAQNAVGDEAEFDFDSDRGDIAAGATPIAPAFIQGGQVRGEILNAANAVVASSTVTCTVK